MISWSSGVFGLKKTVFLFVLDDECKEDLSEEGLRCHRKDENGLN